MPIRISTTLIIALMLAVSLGVFANCMWGGLEGFVISIFLAVFLNGMIYIATLCLKNNPSYFLGVLFALCFSFFGITCTGMPFALSINNKTQAFCICKNNLNQIGIALKKYHDKYEHFPRTSINDNHEIPLFSWRVDIWPILKSDNVYTLFKTNEPWNSPDNLPFSEVCIYGYQCCAVPYNKNISPVNYLAVIGPGTAWRKDRPVKLSELYDNGAHAVVAIEAADSDVHWAEPRDLTVEEALEGLKTGKGLRIATAHQNRINVLFADGRVRTFPAKMPLSLWEKILAGEATNLDDIEDGNFDHYASDMVNVSIIPEPIRWPYLLAWTVWLVCAVMLFYRAVKGRKKPQPPTTNPQTVQA